MTRQLRVLVLAFGVALAACSSGGRKVTLCESLGTVKMRVQATDKEIDGVITAIKGAGLDYQWSRDQNTKAVILYVLKNRDDDKFDEKVFRAGGKDWLPGVDVAKKFDAPDACKKQCDMPADPEIEELNAKLKEEKDPKKIGDLRTQLTKLQNARKDIVELCPPQSHCNPTSHRCELDCAPSLECSPDGTKCTNDAYCNVTSGKSSIIYSILDFPATKWVFLILALVMPLASILTWMERRQSAMMQDRLGPNRANIGPIKLKGILHFVADAVKMIFKEDFIPANVHKGLFALAPILAIAPVFIAFCIIPFGPTVYPHSFWETLDTAQLATNPDAWQFSDSIRMQMFQVDFGLIFYFAVLTLANYGGTIAGWASYNKWALLGGLRSSSQMMSYEVAMGLSLMGAFLVSGTLEPGEMVMGGAVGSMSASNPLNWLWLWQPVGLVLFFTAAIAETKRAPFDIPEGEPEIIGYFVEYSGLRWGLFFLAEFVEIVFISSVICTVFFGGWQVPFLDPDGFRIGGYMDEVTHMWTGGYVLHLPHAAVVGLQFAAFGAKVVLLCWFQLLIRWTLPRFRADQLMNLGWKLLLPLALANVMVTALLKLIFMGA